VSEPRGPRATQRIDDWIKEAIDGAASVNLPDLAVRGRDAFLADTAYLAELFADQLRDLVYQRASKIVQTTRRGPVLLGDEIVDADEMRRRSGVLATKWSNWLEHTGTAHVLLTAMTRTQLAAAAVEREGRAEAEAVRAAFLRRLAAGLTGTQTVGEAFTAPQIERAWAEVHRRAQAA
jgi:hypothetical protein